MKLQLDSSEYQEQPSNEKTVYSPHANDDVPVNDFSDLEEPTFRTTSTYTTPTLVKKSALPGWVIPAIIVVIIAIAAGTILPKKLAKHDISTIATLPKDTIAETLGITLEENPDFVRRIGVPGDDTDGFEAYTTPKTDFAVIYYNGQQYGIIFTSNRYSLFGVSMGDWETHIVDPAMENRLLVGDSSKSSGYPLLEVSQFIHSGLEDYSSQYYFYGTDGGLVVIDFNNTTSRAVRIQYYYDRTRYLKYVDSF